MSFMWDRILNFSFFFIYEKKKMSLSVSTPFNYEYCSSKILNTNIDSNNFDDNYVYRIFGNIAFNQSLKKSTDNIQYTPYCEILIPVSNSSYNVYSNYDCQ